MLGRVFIFEGVDGVGKSSVIRQLAKIFGEKNGAAKDTVIVRIFSGENVVERFMNDRPTSIGYYLVILFKTFFFLWPLKLRGHDVLCDRYVQTVDTFSPDKDFLHNRLFRFFSAPFFLKPDLYISVTAERSVIQDRLKELAGKQTEKDSAYHRWLIENPKMIDARQEEYQKAFDGCTSAKLMIDTSRKTAQEASREIMHLINKNYVG